MQNAIILHGRPGREEYYSADYPSSSNSHWLPWLQKQLIIRDIAAQTPEIPDAWRPNYQTWCRELDRFDITPQTILVAHSMSGGLLLRWLSENPGVRVGNVVLVAPSLGYGWSESDNPRELFTFTMDPQLASRTNKLVIFGSDDDKPGIIESIAAIRQQLPDALYREFSGYGHFLFKNMGSVEFPELLEVLLP